MIPALLRRRRGSLLWLIAHRRRWRSCSACWPAIPLLRGDPRRAHRLAGRPGRARRWRRRTSTAAAGRWPTADGRLVWVNFWATSCEPCRTEMPAMQRLAEAYPDELLILGVDWGEGRDAVADFVDRYGVDVPDPARPDARDLLPLGRDRWPAAALLHRRRGDRPARGDRSAGPGADGGDPRGAAGVVGTCPRCALGADPGAGSRGSALDDDACPFISGVDRRSRSSRSPGVERPASVSTGRGRHRAR